MLAAPSADAPASKSRLDRFGCLVIECLPAKLAARSRGARRLSLGRRKRRNAPAALLPRNSRWS